MVGFWGSRGVHMVEQSVLDRAAAGDPEARGAIVEGCSHVVWEAASVVLSRADHVGQVYHLTWLRLADHLHDVEADSLNEWLVNTAGREAKRLLLLDLGSGVHPGTENP